MLRRTLALATCWLVFVALGSPAFAQTGPTAEPQPAWNVVTIILVVLIVLAVLIGAALLLGRRRGAGETPVEGNADEDATPGRSPYEDGGLGTQR